jgi:DNA-binding protein HU-beta
MNKSELIDAVANRSGVSRADAGKAIDAFFEVLTSAVKSGDKVSWPGFGSFSTSESAARTGRNPQTGEAVDISASTRMKFTPSSALKGELNPNRK